jgi:hypothetical protein
MSKPTRDERLVGELVAASRAALDPNAVAVARGGASHLLEGVALGQDPEAALLLRMLGRRETRRRRTLQAALALAACVLAGFLLLARSGPAPTASASQRFRAAVARLKGEDPLFENLSPVTRDELAGASGVSRGGVTWVGPRGTVLEAPKTLRWRCLEGARRTHVTLRGPGVLFARDVEGASVGIPELGPGRYVVTLRPLGGFARQSSRHSFLVAGREERATYERARSILRAHAPSDLVDLIEAHYAFGRGYLEAAARAAARARSAGGDVARLAAPLVEALTP